MGPCGVLYLIMLARVWVLVPSLQQFATRSNIELETERPLGFRVTCRFPQYTSLLLRPWGRCDSRPAACWLALACWFLGPPWLHFLCS